jgi:hypothetical protein
VGFGSPAALRRSIFVVSRTLLKPLVTRRGVRAGGSAGTAGQGRQPVSPPAVSPPVGRVSPSTVSPSVRRVSPSTVSPSVRRVGPKDRSCRSTGPVKMDVDAQWPAEDHTV